MNLYKEKKLGTTNNCLIQVVPINSNKPVKINYQHGISQGNVSAVSSLDESGKYVLANKLHIGARSFINSNKAVPEEDMINHTEPSYEEFIVDYEEPIEPYRFNLAHQSHKCKISY